MKRTWKKFMTTVSAVVVAGSVLVGGHVFASETTITGGQLHFSSDLVPSVGEFDDVTLDGTIQESNATLSGFGVIDARGTGTGWHVQVKADQFKNASTSETLPENSLTIAAPTLKAEEGASDAQTVHAYGGKIDNTDGLDILSADANGGMGTYTVEPTTLTLKLQPKEVKEGTYTSTITVTSPTGP